MNQSTDKPFHFSNLFRDVYFSQKVVLPTVTGGTLSFFVLYSKKGYALMTKKIKNKFLTQTRFVNFAIKKIGHFPNRSHIGNQQVCVRCCQTTEQNVIVFQGILARL